MAIIKTGVMFTSIEGSIGNVTITKDKGGRNIARQKITSMSNPQTAGQVEQRNKFKKANEIASLFPISIARGFRNEPGRNPLRTPRNRFMSENLKNDFFALGAANPNYEKLVLGKGELKKIEVSAINLAENAGALKLTATIINNSAGTNGNTTDRVLFACVRIQDGHFCLFDTVNRNSGAIDENAIAAPASKSGDWIVIAGSITMAEIAARGGSVLDWLTSTDPTYVQADTLGYGKFTIA